MPSVDTVITRTRLAVEGKVITWLHVDTRGSPRESRQCVMHSAQALLVVSTVGTFAGCLWLAHRISSYFADTHWLIEDYSKATNIMDTQVVVTFFIGLFFSAMLLYFFTSAKQPVLSKDEWRPFKLLKKTPVSSTSAIYRFELPADQSLDLPIGRHVSVRAPINGKYVMRSYTPISASDAKGYFDLMIKTYPTGNLSRIIGELKEGETIEIKGPKGQFNYRPNMAEEIGMIAGGTGLTPCLQVIDAGLRNAEDKTKFSLIYANVTHDEILLKERLDALAAQHPNRFKVHYFLDRPPADWNGGVGFITKDAIDTHLPKPSDVTRLVMCGPPPMINAMKGHLSALQFPEPRVVSKEHDPVFIF